MSRKKNSISIHSYVDINLLFPKDFSLNERKTDEKRKKKEKKKRIRLYFTIRQKTREKRKIHVDENFHLTIFRSATNSPRGDRTFDGKVAKNTGVSAPCSMVPVPLFDDISVLM